MLIRVNVVQECDATTADSSNAARVKNFVLIDLDYCFINFCCISIPSAFVSTAM